MHPAAEPLLCRNEKNQKQNDEENIAAMQNCANKTETLKISAN